MDGSHIRRLARPGAMLCFVSCIVLATAWLASLRWTMFAMAQFGDSVGLKGGMVFYEWTSTSLRRSFSSANGLPLQLDWNRHAVLRKTPMEWWPVFYQSGGRYVIAIPLWIPMVLFGTSGGALRHISRKMRRRGHCSRCGYDQRGLSAGVCPECGARAHRDESSVP